MGGTSSGKVIVSCAVTGSIHTPSMTPHLPITPEEIAGSAVGAAEAGAAILHLHARDPEDGHPVPDPDVYARFLPEIQANCDAVINITTGGGHGGEGALGRHLVAVAAAERETERDRVPHRLLVHDRQRAGQTEVDGREVGVRVAAERVRGLPLALRRVVVLPARFGYALLLPPMRADLGWSYLLGGANNDGKGQPGQSGHGRAGTRLVRAAEHQRGVERAMTRKA